MVKEVLKPKTNFVFFSPFILSEKKKREIVLKAQTIFLASLLFLIEIRKIKRIGKCFQKKKIMFDWGGNSHTPLAATEKQQQRSSRLIEAFQKIRRGLTSKCPSWKFPNCCILTFQPHCHNGCATTHQVLCLHWRYWKLCFFPFFCFQSSPRCGNKFRQHCCLNICSCRGSFFHGLDWFVL